MKPRFSFRLLPLALMPLTIVSPLMHAQCPCATRPTPEPYSSSSQTKAGCLKPAFQSFTLEYVPAPGEANPNVTVTVGEMHIDLTPGEKKHVDVHAVSSAPGPVAGEVVPASMSPSFTMPAAAKIKVNTGGDSSQNNQCKATAPTSDHPGKNTELTDDAPSKSIQNGDPKQAGSGAPPNSGNGGGTDPSQLGRGEPCADQGGIKRDAQNNVVDVPPRTFLSKSLGLNVTGESLAGVLVWNPIQALEPSRLLSYKIRGGQGLLIPPDDTTGANMDARRRILAPDGLMILQNVGTDTLVISNFKKSQLSASDPTLPAVGEVSFRSSTIQKLDSLAVNPPLAVDGQAWSGMDPNTPIGHTTTEAEVGQQTQQRTVWTGTRIIPTGNGAEFVTHYYTSEEVMLQSGPARRILQTHSAHTVNLPDRTLTTIEILQPTADPATAVIASKIVETLKLFPWGEEITARTIDPSGVILTTQYSYHEEAGTPDYGSLKLRINSDGSWEGHCFAAGSDTTTYQIEPWKDSTTTPTPTPLLTITASGLRALADQGRKTQKTVLGPDNTRTEVFVLGTQISKTTRSVSAGITSRTYANAETFRQTLTNEEVREETYYISEGHPSPISHTTTSVSEVQPYLTGSSPSNPPTTRLLAPGITGNSTDPIEYFESISGYPTIKTRTWTDRPSGLVLATERILDQSMEYRSYTYDTKGRQIEERLWSPNWQIVTASTTYDDAAKTMTETDSSGSSIRTTYDGFGRVTEHRRLGVGATAGTQAIPGGTLTAGQAQNDIVTLYSYAARPAVGGVVPLGWVETVTEKAVAINAPATSVALTGHARTTSRTTDGAGRVISTTDVLGKTLATTYARDPNSGLRTTTKFGATTLSESANFLDGQPKSLSGASVVAENYDYAVGSFTTSTIVSNPGFPATDKITTIRDGLGRTISVTAPSGMTAAGVVNFESMLTYGNDGRLATRSRSDKDGNPYYEFFTYTNNGQTVTSGLRYGANLETNVRTRAVTYGFDATEGYCVATTSTYLGAGVNAQQLVSVVKQALHEGIVSDGETLGLVASFSSHEHYADGGGATPKMRSWKNSSTAFPSLHASRTIASSDGTSSVVSEYYNGQLNALSSSAYAAPQLVQHNPLGEPLRETSASGIYWPWLGIEPSTGLVVSRALPSNSATTVETYTYYRTTDTPLDLNIGRLKSRVSLRSPTSTTYFIYNERGQLLKQWGGGDYPLSYEYDSQGRMTKVNTFRSDLGFSTAMWPTSANTETPPPGGRATTQWNYANSAFLNLVTQKFYQGATTPLKYTYFKNGALESRIWQRSKTAPATSPPDDTQRVATHYAYDSLSRLTDITYDTAARVGSSTVITPPVHFEYDENGRVYTRTDAAGSNQTIYSLDGQVLQLWTVQPGSSDPINSVVRGLDALGRPKTLDAAWYGLVNAGNQAEHTAQTVTYDYDDVGNTSRFRGLHTSGQGQPARYYSVIYQSGGDVPGEQYWNDNGGTPANGSSFTLNRFSSANADGLPKDVAMQGASANQTVQSFGYIYDKDRVTKTIREWGDTWKYAYDAKSQVTSARKDLGPDPSAAVFAGTQATYSYDQIGNRTAAQQGGGSTVGTGMRSITYTTTDLNQIYYAYRSSYVDFLGMRESTANSVNFYVNQSTTPVTLGAGDFQGVALSANLFWRKELMTSYSASYTKVKVTENPPASGGSTPPPYPIEEGFVYNPYYQNYLYDADGNVTEDGRWTYLWDAENRLVSMTCPATSIYVSSGSTYVSIPVPGYRITYTYDGLSRRIRKLVERNLTSSPSGYQILNHEGYLYDGWNLIMTVRFDTASSADTPVRGRVASYVWGPDIGSSPYAGRNWQGAGGVGGLLMVIDDANTSALYSATSTSAELAADTTTNTTDTYFPLTDRMGNITGYRRSIPGVEYNQLALTGAVFEYDAFGKEIRSTGPAADRVPFHFSSKFLDAETGLNYYGYRYYDSGNGRWLGRDPIGEDGGENLYGFLHNGPANLIDVLGLDFHVIQIYDPSPYDESSSNKITEAQIVARVCQENGKKFQKEKPQFRPAVDNAEAIMDTTTSATLFNDNIFDVNQKEKTTEGTLKRLKELILKIAKDSADKRAKCCSALTSDKDKNLFNKNSTQIVVAVHGDGINVATPYGDIPLNKWSEEIEKIKNEITANYACVKLETVSCFRDGQTKEYYQPEAIAFKDGHYFPGKVTYPKKGN